MDIEWLRDLVIIIVCLVGLIVLISLMVMVILSYRRIRRVQDSLQKTLDILNAANGVLLPALQTVSMVVLGIREGLSSITNLFQKKEEKRDG